MIHFCRFLCISFFWTLQILFVVHNTTHASYIKVTIFICGWCQAICSKSRCQMREFPLCFPNIPKLLAGSEHGNVTLSCFTVLWHLVLVCHVFLVYFWTWGTNARMSRNIDGEYRQLEESLNEQNQNKAKNQYDQRVFCISNYSKICSL